MKLEIIGIQLSLLKLSGETCSSRSWASQEPGRRKKGGRDTMTELSSAMLSFTLSSRLMGRDWSWWRGKGRCAATPCSSLALPWAGGLPVSGEVEGRLHTAPLESRVRQHSCLLLSRPLETRDNCLDSCLLWIAFSEAALTCCGLTRVP